MKGFNRIVGVDTETYIARKGRATPTFVCCTYHIIGKKGKVTRGIITDRDEFVRVFRDWITAPRTLVIAHNAFYDLGIACFCDPTLLGAVFLAIDQGRVSCTQTREKLITIAHGHATLDPAIGVPPNYRLYELVKKYAGVDISEKKEKWAETAHWRTFSQPYERNRTIWRVNYHQLHGLPAEDWPTSASEYAMEDADWVILCHQKQCEAPPTPAGSVVQADGIWIVDEVPNMRAGWALALASIWGLRTDPEKVEQTLKEWIRIRDKGWALAASMGFMRGDSGFKDGEVPRPRLKADREAVMEAHGWDASHVWPKRGKPWSVSLKDLTELVIEAYEGSGQSVPRGDPTENMVKKALTAWVAQGFDPDEFEEGSVKGNVKYSADVLRFSGHPGLEKYANCSVYINYMAKFADTLRAGTKYPITSRPNVIVRTGRTSWSAPPLQQPPKKGGFRECHVPRPGYVYVSVDYDAIEMCALAQTHIDWDLGSTMADAIRAGKDLHTDFATYTIGMDYLEGVRLHAADTEEGRAFDDGPRFRAKAGNFGFPGGMGPRTFIQAQLKQGATLDMFAPETGSYNEALNTAKELKKSWVDKWPEMVGYFQIVAAMTELGEYTAIQPVSGRLRGAVGYCDGCNTYFQGRTADGAKAALWEVSRRAYGAPLVAAPNVYNDVLARLERPSYAGTPDDPLWGVRPLLMMHDEIIAEVPRANFARAADEMALVMREVMQLYIPDIPIGAEPAASEYWTKGAATVRNKAGVLQIWRPKT